MSEKLIQEGIQDAIQAMDAYANADVVINDWTILDQADSAAPYVIIENSDTFKAPQTAGDPSRTWEIPVNTGEEAQ